jgi:hypothetical protein
MQILLDKAEECMIGAAREIKRLQAMLQQYQVL